jgi:hypothetical protein
MAEGEHQRKTALGVGPQRQCEKGDRRMPQPQSFKNHARVVPAFHVGVFFPFVANLLWTGYRLTQGVNTDTVMAFIMAIAFLLLFFTVRVMVTTVQDRVIRLEMRLRLRGLLPADLQSQVDRLTHKQLVALRFASDAELSELVREVVAGKLTTPKDIKMRVKDWQADYLRA